MNVDAPASSPEPGELELPRVLASRYRLVRRIGNGGMGVVYAGDHVELKTRVAIKLLQPRLSQDASARARFLREARLAASIDGEHSARIHDVGTDEGRPFIVMEFLTGESLDARLAREGPIPYADAVTIVLQLLAALAEAHAKGVVHRDIKPANLFLVHRPGERVWVKVLDFGISKVIDRVDTTSTTSVKLTEPRTLLGSPEYMSPEQLRDSAGVDARSDLWSCGVLLYELLSGSMPFEGPTLADLCVQIVSRAPRPLPPGAVPSGLSRVIDRCLRKDARDRPQSAYELAMALAPFAAEPARALLPRIRAWSPADDAPGPRRSSHVAASGLLLVALSGALAFAVASLRAPATASPAASAERADAVEPLQPIPTSSSPPADAPPTSSASSASNAANAASAANATASERTAPAASAPPIGRPKALRPAAKRIQDLDGIELLP